MRAIWTFSLVILVNLLSPLLSWADQLILNDGTVVEGTILSQGEKYWVKGADGKSKIVPKSDVKKYVTGSASTATPAATAAPGPAAPTVTGGSGDFGVTKRKADGCETPTAAVAAWQKFIDSKPSADDLAMAKAESDKWQKMATDGAEKVNGKWISGEPLKQLHTKVNEKLTQAMEDMHNERTLAALKTMEEVRKMYPNSFEANFITGYLTLLQHKDNDAISYLEQAVKLRPDDPSACSNLGIALFATRKDLVRGIVLMHHAVEIEDSQESVHNLVMSLSLCPDQMRYNEKVKPALESARLLASKYGLDVHADHHGDHWLLMPMREEKETEFAGKQPAGTMLSSGTGFIINDDGLILTNRHVVADAKSYLVMLDGGVKKAGEIVVIDTDQDLALLRVKTDTKLPIAVFTDAEKTGEGAACFAMGFPLIDRMGASIKVTQGIVSGTGRSDAGADVVIDAKVNPGNSGGPLLDKFGRVIGIITMKTRSARFEDSYGLAIGAPKIKEFLEKNHVKITPGAAGTSALTAEEVVAKMKPATVCIIATHER